MVLEEGGSKPEIGDRVHGYREQLKALQRASEAVRGLRERTVGLDARVHELTLEAAALSNSDEIERESALTLTRNVIESKLCRAREKLHQAEGGLSAQLEAVRSEFSRLHLIFRLHRISVEKRLLLEKMVPGSPILSVEQVVVNFKSITELFHLEVNAQSVEALVPQAERLLERVAAEADFVVPPATPSASEGIAVARASEPRLYGPYLFRGMEQFEIEAQLKRIRTLDPGLDLAGATRRLAELHPELFSTEAEVAAMNAPLPGLEGKLSRTRQF